MKNLLSISAIILTIGFVSIPIVWSDSEFHWDDVDEYKRSSSGVATVTNAVYSEECGSCHMAYPPGLLPASAWRELMSGLEDHFADNAELDSETHQLINEYLLTNSADKSTYRRSQSIKRSIKPGDITIRISQTPYFIHEHNEIPARMVSGNPQVNSFSQCNACHLKAEQGLFDEDEINIPGYGQWDD